MSYFVPQKEILGILRNNYLAEMSQNITQWQIIEMSNSTKQHADNSGNHADL